jgi:light-regulated signal transduction histidine kinase (bacteriophytochrome)
MKPSLRIASIYLLVGFVWILVSDKIVLLFLDENEIKSITYFQNLKGIFYVLTTGFLLYFLIDKYYKTINNQLREVNFLNKELSRKAAKLEVSNKELEQFAFVASHDLQEPLRMITAHLNQLNKNYSNVLDDKAKRNIHFSVDGAKRMRQIILDLLEFSRIGKFELKPEKINMNELMQEVLLLQRKNIESSGAKIIIGDLPVINAYKLSMIQIFQNLISNSIKYAQKNVPLQISISCVLENNYWLFCVEDNGIGIDSKYFNDVFMIFKRLHSSDEYSGSGMGLAIVKRNVELHRGKIWIESEYGKGSKFFFSIFNNLNE